MIAGPLAFLGVLEGALRVSGYGNQPGFFIPDDKPGYLRTNPDFARTYFPPQFDISPLNFRLARHKDPGHVRIFILGESAARGIPEPGFGFAPILRAQLRSAYPGREVELYNLGIVAINSHVVYQVAKEAAELEPDLFVVYMGNNEVVGPFGPGSANRSAMPALPLIRASIWTTRTRTGQLFARMLSRLQGHAGGDLQWRGMATFTDKTVRGDDPRLETVYSNFRRNLADILEIARSHGIRTVVSTVVSNLRDCPPFTSLHRVGMTPEQTALWKSAYDEGRYLWEIGDGFHAMKALDTALLIDPEYADAHFILGRVLEDRGALPAARRHYVESVHWDALRFRPDPRINEIIRDVAAQSRGSALLVDAALKFGSEPQSSGSPTGREILWEHVHFNWDGDRQMARMLAKEAAGAMFGDSSPPGTWLDDKGCADAVGFSPFGRLQMLRAMESILAKPPFSNQLTFGEDQLRYKKDVKTAVDETQADGTPESSKARLAAALRRDPENADLHLRLSEVELATGHPERAIQAVDRVLELEPPSPDLLVRRAHSLGVLKRYKEAQEAILGAIRLGPDYLPAYTELVDILRKTGDFETGRSIVSEALKVNPSSDYLRLKWADLLFFHGDGFEAELECQAVLTRNPGSSEALGRLVSLLMGEGRKDDAFKLMAEARKTQPLNFENDMALARAYEERHKDDEVADCLYLATQSGPAEPQVHVFLARRLQRISLPKEALVEFARAKRAALLEGNLEMAGAISAMMYPVEKGN